MQARVNLPPLQADGSRLSSSLPSQSGVDQCSPSSHTHARCLDSCADEPTLAHRTAALRQLHRIQAPPQPQPQQQPQQQQQQQKPQQQHQRTTSAGGRSSLASQPVVVRTYSVEADEDSSRPHAMTGGSRSRSNRRMTAIEPIRPPAVEDFSIEGILQAIEPDIQTTLDSIAEICGRSRLSLANEHGSHRPPFGEIGAPSRPAEHGLLTVEEASSSAERLAGENVLVVGDDISTLDGRDPRSSTFGLLENIRNSVGLGEHGPPVSRPWDENSHPYQQADTQRTSAERSSVPMPPATTEPQHPPHTGDTSLATSIPLLWGRLGGESGIDSRLDRHGIQTQPVISEVHLDVEAERSCQHPPESDTLWTLADSFRDDGHTANKSLARIAAERLSLLSDLRGWLGWWNGMRNLCEQTEEDPSPSAEMKLRAVLERHNTCLNAPPPTPV